MSASVLLLHEYYFSQSWICPLGFTLPTIVCAVCSCCHTFSFSNGSSRFFWPNNFILRIFSDNLGLSNVGGVQPGNCERMTSDAARIQLWTQTQLYGCSFLTHGHLTDSINPLQLQKVSISFPSLCHQCERVTWANLLLCSVLCLLVVFMFLKYLNVQEHKFFFICDLSTSIHTRT